MPRCTEDRWVKHKKAGIHRLPHLHDHKIVGELCADRADCQVPSVGRAVLLESSFVRPRGGEECMGVHLPIITEDLFSTVLWMSPPTDL